MERAPGAPKPKRREKRSRDAFEAGDERRTAKQLFEKSYREALERKVGYGMQKPEEDDILRHLRYGPCDSFNCEMCSVRDCKKQCRWHWTKDGCPECDPWAERAWRDKGYIKGVSEQ